MNPVLRLPPITKHSLTPPAELAEKLSILIGRNFPLSGKSRTDGSNLRKIVASTMERTGLPIPSPHADFEVMPPRGKGVPKILLEYVDTYIVTSGDQYNLQVWNRNPAAESVQIQYTNGETLTSSEVRFVLVRIDTNNFKISSIAVVSPKYIVTNFGSFGKPTIKQQLIISSTARQSVLNQEQKILFYDDIFPITDHNIDNDLTKTSIHAPPTAQGLLPLNIIRDRLKENIIGKEIKQSPTKNRGQFLEELTARALGYIHNDSELLAGSYPDIRNQMLEVKIQDAATVDLGMYSPEFDEVVPNSNGFTTRTVRYFIALANSKSNIIEGAIICPGAHLGKHFTYVGDQNYKCQRSIPMAFFERFKGRSLFNP